MPPNGLTGAVFCITWLLIQIQGVSRVPTGLEANLWYFCLKLHLQGPWASYFSNSVSHKTSQHLPFVISKPHCFLNTHSMFWVKVPLQKLPGGAWAQSYYGQRAHTLPLPCHQHSGCFLRLSGVCPKVGVQGLWTRQKRKWTRQFVVRASYPIRRGQKWEPPIFSLSHLANFVILH